MRPRKCRESPWVDFALWLIGGVISLILLGIFTFPEVVAQVLPSPWNWIVLVGGGLAWLVVLLCRADREMG